MNSRFKNVLNFAAKNTSNYIEMNGAEGFLSPKRGRGLGALRSTRMCRSGLCSGFAHAQFICSLDAEV